MEVFEVINNRRSIRAYKSEPVPEENIKKLLEATRLAPSASNRQNWNSMNHVFGIDVLG